MKHLRVDEKHAGRKFWLTLVSCVDHGKARVVYAAEGRDQKTLNAFGHALTDEQLAGIESVAMATEEAKTMKGSRYWWLYHPKHLPRKVKSRFRRLQEIARKTAKAWEFNLELNKA
jgi:hypothetical protein